MPKLRSLSADQRVAGASQCAFELAIDSMHDTALQEALMRRNDDALAAAAAIQAETLQSIKEQCRDEPFLLHLLHVTTDATVRNFVVMALVDLRSVAAMGEITNLLQDPKTKGQRGSLMYALSKIPAPIDLAILVTLMVEDNDEAVKYEALHAIERDRVKHAGKLDLKRHLATLKRAVAANLTTTRGHDYCRDAAEILTRRLCAGTCGGCSCK